MQKSTTVPVQPPGRKNGKQKNGKGNKSNQRTSTTPKPIYTTVMQNQFSVNTKSTKNKSKPSQSASSASNNFKQTSTARPRTTMKVPTVNAKSHQDLDTGNKNNHNVLSSRTDKLHPANSNIYEKAPGKAPKQVKEGSFSTPSADLRTSNPMSKMFERYEKIEQIYPELKPYKDNGNPAFFTVSNGNGKPSRENSKSFSSSFVSLNPAPQKKNSPSEISTATRQQVIAQAANEKNGKGSNQFIFSSVACAQLVFQFVFPFNFGNFPLTTFFPTA